MRETEDQAEREVDRTGGRASGERRPTVQRREPSANIQLIDLSVHESWVEWFQGLLKLHSAGDAPQGELG